MYYKLNDDKSVSRCKLLEWAEQLEEMYKKDTHHIGEDCVNNMRISTVWLGLDHQWVDGESPLLFETMIFKDNNFDSDYLERYSTYEQALEGHKKAVEWVKNGCKEE